jgi:hypothetical protein
VRISATGPPNRAGAAIIATRSARDSMTRWYSTRS